MTDFAALLQQGASNAWLFVPSAVLLGALHGLEPGHSKTMMAAFIVAIRGTVAQAVMLGLAATLSHTAVVWLIALAGIHFGSRWSAESTEPYLQLASGLMIVGVALWMLWRTRRDLRRGEHHEHIHADLHGHAAPSRHIDTPHGPLRLELHEQEGPARWRLHGEHGQVPPWDAADVTIQLERPDGRRDTFLLAQREGYLESADSVDEPHEFIARVRLREAGHSHDYDLEFVEPGHSHAVKDFDALDLTAPGYQDAHELAHADDIRRRFSGRVVTNGQILLFGLTAGLIPCPAAITVLLLCLQLKKLALGAALVLCFSVGLALTLVLSGTVAAMAVRRAGKAWSGFGDIARKAPYVSGVLILLVGLYVGSQGLQGVMHPAAPGHDILKAQQP